MLICEYLSIFNIVLTCMIELCVFGIVWGRNQSFDMALMVEITLFNIVVLGYHAQRDRHRRCLGLVVRD